MKTKILLNTSKDVKDFVFAVSTLPSGIQIKVSHGDFVVDGRSILGLLSIHTKGILNVETVSEKPVDENSISRLLYPWSIPE